MKKIITLFLITFTVLGLFVSCSDSSTVVVNDSGYFGSEINEMIEEYKRLEEPDSNDSNISIIDFYNGYVNNSCGQLLSDSNRQWVISVDLEADSVIKDYEGHELGTLSDVMQGIITINWSFNSSDPDNSEYSVSYNGTFERKTFDGSQITTGTTIDSCSGFYPGDVDFDSFYGMDSTETDLFAKVIANYDSLPNYSGDAVFYDTYKYDESSLEYSFYTTASNYFEHTVFKEGSTNGIPFTMSDSAYQMHIFTETENYDAEVQKVFYSEMYDTVKFELKTIMLDGIKYRMPLAC